MSNKNFKYDLGDNLPLKENILYACQHVIFFIASAFVMPIVVGYALGLSQVEVAGMLQRTFILCGIISFLQTTIGHRYPIMDAPAGLWAGLLILMTSSIETIHTTPSMLRTDLETGIIIAGLFVMILALLGLMKYIVRLFTPIINGIVICLMVLQISQSIVKGLFGITSTNVVVDHKSVIVFMFTMLIILFLNVYGKGIIKSIATFIGVLAGWFLAYLMGLTTSTNVLTNGVFSLPKAFAWGRPTFNIGIVVTCVIAAFALLSMVFASVGGMSEVVEEKPSDATIKKSMVLHGLATTLTGIFPTVPFMPYVSSIGIVKMTGIAARAPFLIASVLMLVFGFISPIGLFFSTIPNAVGYAALIIIYALILGQGLREFQKVNLENRENFIVGISMLIGIGVMFLPASTFSNLPQVASYLLSNGLIDGIITAFLLEHLILKNRNQEEKND